MPYMKLCNEGTGVLLLRSCILIILLPHSEQRVVSAHLTQLWFMYSLSNYICFTVLTALPPFLFLARYFAF